MSSKGGGIATTGGGGASATASFYPPALPKSPLPSSFLVLVRADHASPKGLGCSEGHHHDATTTGPNASNPLKASPKRSGIQEGEAVPSHSGEEEEKEASLGRLVTSSCEGFDWVRIRETTGIIQLYRHAHTSRRCWWGKYKAWS